MGVNISKLVNGKEIDLASLSGKVIGIDSFNWFYQFLSIIRDRMTGEPLKDSKGRVTSHLSGILYRTANLIEAGIKTVWVFDGEPPAFKKRTLEKRKRAKIEAEEKMKKALERGEPAFKYAQATSRLTDEILEDGKELLKCMGIPFVQAPSEGEAQVVHMTQKGDVWASGSQDWDSLLFGSPRLIRNLSISGRKKKPGQNTFYELKPELIELKSVLDQLGIDRKQLIIIGMLIGTDYSQGVKGIGPKKALKLVKEQKNLESVINGLDWTEKTDINDIFDFFMNPPSTEDYDLEWKEPDADKILKLMVDEHGFLQERMEKVVEKLKSSYGKSSQDTLGKWFGK